MTSEIRSDDLLSTEKENKRVSSKAKSFLRSALKGFFVHVVLAIVCGLYVLVGGYLFAYLEGFNSLESCLQAFSLYNSLESTTVHNLMQIGSTYSSDINSTLAVSALQKQISNFSAFSLHYNYNGVNCYNAEMINWSLTRSILFSVTVITTVGYGNIVPRTNWGRVVCITYATVGIPLMLLYLGYMSTDMVKAFRFIYTKICCCQCLRKKPLPSNEDETATTKAMEKRQLRGAVIMVTNDDEEEADDELIQNIPVTVSLILIAAYVMWGAGILTCTEGWSFVEASYFCFITISTIGFGDIVPGIDETQTESGRLKLFGLALYGVIGIALLSMCFTLIQEEMIDKLKRIRKRCGCNQQDEIDDQDEERERKEQATRNALVYQLQQQLPSLHQKPTVHHYYSPQPKQGHHK